MRSLAVLILLTGVVPAASAQRTLGYWFVAPGAATSGGHSAATVHLGGGAEIGLLKGVALGIEAGALGDTHHFTDTVFGIASLNGYYHFRPSRDVRLDPFATAGYSLAFRRGTANLVNYGGGLNWWFARTVAARAEFRDHVHRESPSAVHFWEVRLGLSFTELWP